VRGMGDTLMVSHPRQLHGSLREGSSPQGEDALPPFNRRAASCGHPTPPKRPHGARSGPAGRAHEPQMRIARCSSCLRAASQPQGPLKTTLARHSHRADEDEPSRTCRERTRFANGRNDQRGRNLSGEMHPDE
jgi:hypothetical protein